MTTSLRSRLKLTSSSTIGTPVSIAAWKATKVFSGYLFLNPRWAIIQGELQDICSSDLCIESHSMFGVSELADDFNIVFSRKDFKDKHFILLPLKKVNLILAKTTDSKTEMLMFKS
jgi:hypothetical protein